MLGYGNPGDRRLGWRWCSPTRRVWNGLKGLRKDNTGYDLRDLFIGSEGTLGVITAAVLKLLPEANDRGNWLCWTFFGTSDAVTLFERLRRGRRR